MSDTPPIEEVPEEEEDGGKSGEPHGKSESAGRANAPGQIKPGGPATGKGRHADEEAPPAEPPVEPV